MGCYAPPPPTPPAITVVVQVVQANVINFSLGGNEEEGERGRENCSQVPTDPPAICAERGWG